MKKLTLEEMRQIEEINALLEEEARENVKGMYEAG
jgi:hypothetical protein